ncbi:MAG TPA: hypothetical protein VK152_01005 [Paludibacter sp.]|nr:hypothetical protein [Paludibacter sp.]
MNKNTRNILLLAGILLGINLFGQGTEQIKGNVSFISSQNVYVQFVNTEGIHIGDTLYLPVNNKLLPALLVDNLSSISCVGKPFPGINLSVGNRLLATKKADNKPPLEVVAQNSKEAISVNDQAIVKSKKKNNDKGIDGRVSLSSYINNTSDSTINNVMRFNFSLDAQHINNSKFSIETYISLTNKHIYTPFTESVTDTLTNETTNILVNRPQSSTELKVYDLALRYDFNKDFSLTVGRKINPNLANIGAVDGLQFEKSGRVFSYGAVVGSRPDTYTYSFNPNLLQFGAFVGFQTKKEYKRSQTSLALFNQMNNMKTDRRFIYLQHNNSLLKNLDLFCSLEMDLYGAKIKTDSALTKDISGNDSTARWTTKTPVNMLDLTSAYVSLNYRPFRNLSMSLSYDTRKNVYYYETYKSYVDSLLDKETRQGFRFQASYRPFSRLSIGGNAGYRLANGSAVSNAASSNGYGYLTYSQLPELDASLTLDATVLKTAYFTNALIYGGSLSKDYANGKIFAELSYHYADFTYITSGKFRQHIGELSLSWRIAKKLMLSADFEVTKEVGGTTQKRAFINLSQRF